MATYDYTQGGADTSAKMMAYAAVHSCFTLRRRFDVETVIAWNATLTAAAKITSGDIFQIISLPDDHLLLNAGGKCIEAFAACTSLDFGLNGGVEILSAQDFNGATVGDHKRMVVGGTWGADNYMGYLTTSADTLDIQFNADETSGTVSFWAVIVDVSSDVLDE